MIKEFSLGCNGRGIMHTKPLPVDDQFRMIKESGVFDHFDRIPQPGEEREYLSASEKHGVPMTTGLWTYVVGQDEDLVRRNLRYAKEGGIACHNLMIATNHAEGRVVTDDEVAEFYLKAFEFGETIGVTICAEVHIYMFSEDFRRVLPVAEKVRAQGIPFNFVLDHSHVLLKIENEEEQDVSDIRADVDDGRLKLDPFESGNIIDEWIGENMVVWQQVRPVAPNGPKNRSMMGRGDRYGRACQYPFIRPGPGEWTEFWHAYKVEPCKEVVRRMLRHHWTTPDSPMKWVTTDMIDMPDYGGGVGYSLWDQNVAIAQWIRDTWKDIKAASGESGGASN